jgi:hypothetical protein
MAAVAMISCAALADTLTMNDGTTHDGTLVSATSRTVTFREGRTLHHYSRSKIRSIALEPSAASESQSAASRYSETPSRNSVSVPAGTEISVLTNQEINSKTTNQGQTFPADVAENVTNSAGQVVIPKGSEAELVIRNVNAGGTTGTSELALDLQSIKVGGRRYMVSTEDVSQSGRSGLGKNKRTAEMVGGGAVLGTLIGAVAGGGKGAAIGAATGAAAGAGTQILTRGKTVEVPAESTLRFKLDQPLQLRAAY